MREQGQPLCGVCSFAARSDLWVQCTSLEYVLRATPERLYVCRGARVVWPAQPVRGSPRKAVSQGHALSREARPRRAGYRWKTLCAFSHLQPAATTVRPPCVLTPVPGELCPQQSTARRSRTGTGRHAPGGQSVMMTGAAGLTAPRAAERCVLRAVWRVLGAVPSGQTQRCARREGPGPALLPVSAACRRKVAGCWLFLAPLGSLPAGHPKL